MSISLNGDGIVSGVTTFTTPLTGVTTFSSVVVGSGSTSIPSISPSGDNNTGVFFPSADTVALSSGGTERLKVDSDGNINIDSGGVYYDAANNRFAVGTTQPSSKLSVGGDTSSQSVISLDYNPTNSTAAAIRANHSTGEVRYDAVSAYFPTFYSNGTERARIDSSGRLLVGTSSALSSAGYTSNLQVEANSADAAAISVINKSNDAFSGGLVSYKARGTSAVQANDGLFQLRITGYDGSAYVETARIACDVDGTPGANDMPGRLVFSTTADGASSPTERMRIGNAGTVDIGTLNPTASSYLFVRRDSGPVAYFDRKTNDGTIIEFRQDDATEGTISVSGTTVSYNGAHLSRWSQLVGIDPYDNTARPEILRGTVMSNLDEMCDWTCPASGDCQDNEQLNKTEISSVDDDPNVAGVFQSWDDDDDTWVNDYYLAMTGDFVIRIAAGTTVQRGDLLCSAGDGTARPQGDRYIKDSTIAKVTSTTVSCTHPDGSYCVPCVLMAC